MKLKEEEIVAKVQERFGERVKPIYVKPKRLKLLVKKESLAELASHLKSLGFDHVASVAGIDHKKDNEFEVVYHLSSYSQDDLRSIVLALATRIPREDPVVSSLCEVWKSAEYHERETFEMFGIVFQGHPKLERLLLPEDWDDIPPLRKDFMLPGR